MFGYYDENHHEFLFFEFIKVNFKADSSNSSQNLFKKRPKIMKNWLGLNSVTYLLCDYEPAQSEKRYKFLKGFLNNKELLL